MTDFPRLHPGSYYITSPATPTYNCIAWAAGEDFRWWWPTPGFYYWPAAAPAEETIDAFVAAFESLGFVACDDNTYEDGWTKVAIFATASGTPTHMARQLSPSEWTSKLGRNVDISHVGPDDLAGGFYGEVVRFLKRRKGATPNSP